MTAHETFVAILPTTVNLNHQQAIEYRNFINLAHLGDENCNEMKDGKFVSKYPEKETQEYMRASMKSYTSFQVFVKATFDTDGNVTFALVDSDEYSKMVQRRELHEQNSEAL
jgi:hypothetical protein